MALPAYLQGTQNLFNQQAQQTANSNFQAKAASLAGTFADQAKLNRLRAGMNDQYAHYMGIQNDPNADPVAKEAAYQYNSQLGMLGDSTDIRNVNSVADSYKTIMTGAPNVAELLNKQKLAKIRADSLVEAMRGRARSAAEVENIKAAVKRQESKDKYGSVPAGADDYQSEDAGDDGSTDAGAALLFELDQMGGP